MTPDLVLASTSPFRRELLGRLGLPFRCVAPAYDELSLPGVAPVELAVRHAVGKARSVAAEIPDAVVVGSDQVAELDGTILGKPGTHEAAVAQLMASSGRTVVFHTAVAVAVGDDVATRLVRVAVRFRSLTLAQIEDYVCRDRPLRSAGSFKVETLGISLFEKVETDDFTALVGLPLISVVDLLADRGIRVLGGATGRGGCATGGQQVR